MCLALGSGLSGASRVGVHVDKHVLRDEVLDSYHRGRGANLGQSFPLRPADFLKIRKRSQVDANPDQIGKPHVRQGQGVGDVLNALSGLMIGGLAADKPPVCVERRATRNPSVITIDHYSRVGELVCVWRRNRDVAAGHVSGTCCLGDLTRAAFLLAAESFGSRGADSTAEGSAP